MNNLSKIRRPTRVAWKTGFSAMFFLVVLAASYIDSARAEIPPQDRTALSVSRVPQFAIADFDGDNRPDLASVEFGRNGPQNYEINFRLTSGRSQPIDIVAPEGGLQLRAQDVNGDSFPDLVVTTFWTDRPVAVLLNDGRGNFTRSEPSVFPEAFEKTDNSITPSKGNKSDAVAALSSRYSHEFWQEDRHAVSLLRVVRLTLGESLCIVAFLFGHSSFGRAPPANAIHS
jgi:hypothetical protein